MGKRKDIVGQRFGRLVVDCFAFSKKISGKSNRFWKCSCDCGGVVEVSTNSLTTGNTKSCGCLKEEAVEALVKNSTIHGLRKTKEYYCWSRMLCRVTNPNYPYHEIYSKRGIYQPWLESFTEFIAHIGFMPKDGKSYSVERIDNTVGYYPGNVKWIPKQHQPRNQSIREDNTSGVTGVSLLTAGELLYWMAKWTDVDKKRKQKLFSVKKLGYTEALNSAIAYREQKILELENNGVFYAHTHGKPAIST